MANRRTKERPSTDRMDATQPDNADRPAAPPAAQPMPRCIYCAATTVTAVRRINVHNYCGVTHDGERYTSIVRRRMKCKSCGRYQIHVNRPYDPDKWRN